MRIVWVEPAFFEVLGVDAAIGRTFRDDEGANGLTVIGGEQLAPDTARTVVLTHAAWQRLFAGDPDVLGRDVRINGIVRTVVGVLPSDFVGPLLAGPLADADFYLPFALDPVVAHAQLGRRSFWLNLIGRLRPGATHGPAERTLGLIGADLAREYPDSDGRTALAAVPLRDALVGNTRTPLLVLMASAGLVLLIGCANLAGAFLSRALSRRKELAVRTALGARRGHLVRQLLTESTLLALAGGAAGLFLAHVVLALLGGLARPALPAHADLSIDGGTVLFTAVLALATGLAFGSVPAISLVRSAPQWTLRDQTRGTSESRHSRRLRGVLVAGQIALCVSLLAGAALLARSLWAMTSASLGFEPDGVLTAAVQLPSGDYATPERRARFLEEFVERLGALPGVEAAATSNNVPGVVFTRMGFTLEGAPPPPADAQQSFLFASVSDDYFRTLRIPVRRGRTFDAGDRADAPRTIVISESMARRYWPAGDALGSRIRQGSNVLEVIGIVGDVRNDPARPDAEPMAYASSRQNPWPIVRILLRTAGDPFTLVRSIERELAAIDSGLPLDRPMTLRTVIGNRLAGRRLPTFLLAGFAVLAVTLASVGVYALFAALVAVREREFGVRLALGARRGAVAGLVLRQGAVWMTAGLVGGGLGIVVVVRSLRGLLYEVPPFDPVSLGGAVVILIGCATIGLLVPLRRATRVDPVVALRVQ